MQMAATGKQVVYGSSADGCEIPKQLQRSHLYNLNREHNSTSAVQGQQLPSNSLYIFPAYF